MKIVPFSLLLIGFMLSGLVIHAQDDQAIENRIDELLSEMTLQQKIGQLNMRGTSSRVKGSLPESLKQAVREGRIGTMLNVMNKEYVDELQRLAVEESPQGIPIIFARDVIHGFKTIFPIPLGIAATWNSESARISSDIAAHEATGNGIRWTFAPMLDITRDSRWGRIAESPGEDPYLASVMAEAYIKGFQGEDLSDPTSMVACAKHFMGYGAPIGGRDYNTAYIPEPLMRNIYLPPFVSAIDAGAATVMSSFNEMNGVPASGSKFLLTDVLRGELEFDGFVVSDWHSVIEMIPHGFAADQKHAAELAANAGLEVEMMSTAYEDHLHELIKDEKVSEAQLDFLVRNILRIKLRMGLFENPHRDKNHDGDLYDEKHLAEAQKMAAQSMVLLKNNGILPLTREKKSVALIGPLMDKPREQLGTWTFDGDGKYSVTPKMAFQGGKGVTIYAEGLEFSRDLSTKGFGAAIDAAKAADHVVFIGGEEAILSGEAHSRAEINLPGAQVELIEALAATGKPIVLVIMAGRPITITNIIDKVDAVIMAWHPGTMAGPALYDVLYGNAEPGGRLPVTWPKTSGQLPLFYNHKSTGRPANPEKYVQMYDIPVGAWQSSLGNESHYLDVGFRPHFPFGYGLNYTTFKYSNLRLSADELPMDGELEITATIKNTGDRAGSEVVQLYIQDKVGTITRPIRELKGFERIHLEPGASKKVTFRLSADDLAFFKQGNEPHIEPGQFNVWVAKDAESGLQGSFELKP